MINPTFTMEKGLEEFKASFFSTVMSAAERMQRKNTEILAAQCSKAARNSMKKAAKLSKKKRAGLKRDAQGVMYSNPGEPPLEKVGLIKKHLYYAWDNSRNMAIAGPAKLNIRGQVTRSLEKGEPTLIETGEKPNRKIIQVPMQARPFMAPAMERVMEPANLKRVYEKSLKARKGF